MKDSPLVLLGSSRKEGNTKKAIQEVFQDTSYNLIDLSEKTIGYYDYEETNLSDDFLSIAEEMMFSKKIVLATPVYWYTMSAQMKTFVDRLSDLITVRKDIGRALRGKSIYLITSYGSSFPIGFELPIQLTCSYLELHYMGCYYHHSGDDAIRLQENTPRARAFRELLFS